MMGNKLEVVEPFLAKIEQDAHRKRMEEILLWILETFPDLKLEHKWNQSMFTHDGTFIIAFSVSKNHISVAPEKYTMDKFRDAVEEAGYTHSKMLFRIPFKDEVNYPLLKEIIEFNIEDKRGYETFWRK